MKEQQLNRLKYLVEILEKAAKEYYANNKEMISDLEYDKLYDELVQLEQETGIVLANSPSIKVGYEAVEGLPKEKHEEAMLSLDKTKDREQLRDWLQDKEGILSWKLDGLTIVLTYKEGSLKKAVTRGNGEIGEVVTNNAKTFKNLPVNIAFQGELVLRGEAVISYEDFETINSELSVEEEKYKNPRNLCSGSVRQLNNEITAKRKVQFLGFHLVKAEGMEFSNSKEKQMLFLKELGFNIVEYEKVTRDNIIKSIQRFEEKIIVNPLPSDGLVLTYEEIAYGESLGRTAKFPRHSIAFKWKDELKETILLSMEWSASRTGLINPVAIFEPVELEGTTVSRASVHNISIVKNLKLGIGDRITVYKANMIIPQIGENLTCSNSLEIPDKCPVCNQPTEICQTADVQALYCTNKDCDAKKTKAFSLFVSRNAMNIDGMSEATLEKFLGKGFLHEFADLYCIERFKEEIIRMEGFGEKSYQNLMDSIENSKVTTLPRFIYALGIENIGVANAKMLCKAFEYDINKLINASKVELSDIEGIGPIIGEAFQIYMEKNENREQIERLLSYIQITPPEVSDVPQNLVGKSFCITGSLVGFESRDKMKEVIEAHGGKVTGTVTSKTSGLINNDSLSTSGKNKKAKDLQIPVYTEEEFVKQFL